MLHALIMAGGAGTRFWPASRNLRPKQLLRLVGNRSMLQDTVDRLSGFIPQEQIQVFTNRALVPAVREQLPQLPPDAVLGEPCKRDTAACIGLAATKVLREDPEGIMLVMPADHVIAPREQLLAAVNRAVQLVENQPERIVAFGIRPTYPAETFGYIECGEALDIGDPPEAAPIYAVEMFREKPSAEVAEEYLAAGKFYWNSGIFVWKAATILEAVARFEPEMHQHLQTIAATLGTDRFEATLENEFADIEGKSIDYAVMERYGNSAVIEADFDWSDLGSWGSLARMRGPDEHGNTIDGRHLGLNTQGCIVRGCDEHLIVTLGLEDCVVVHTADATLVARKHDEGSIRQIVKLIKEQGWDEYL